tara:strand:- start:353 stop:655 length:303 start_codon:yes stop_codon:yes gene_type:complete
MNYKDEFNVKVEFEIDKDNLGFRRRITFSDSFEKLPDLIKANLLQDLEKEIDKMFMETLNVLSSNFLKKVRQSMFEKTTPTFEDSAFDKDGNFKYKLREE